MAFAERDSRTKKHTGRWAVDFWWRVKGQPEKRMRRAFDSKAEAEAAETYARATGLWPQQSAEEAKGPSFKEAAEDMRAKHDVWLAGRDVSGQRRLDWVIEHIGHLPVAHVSTEDLDGLVAALRKRKVINRRNDTGKLRGRTINGYLTMASAVLTWAASRPKVYGDFRVPEVPWAQIVETRIYFMTMDQQALLVRYYLEQGWPEEALIVRTLCQSGMRWSEFAGLEPHMITFSKNAKGSEVAWIKLDRTKTNHPRDIPITPGLGREIRALIGNDWRPNYSRSRTRFDVARKLLGLPPSLTLYGARHAAATYLTKQGMPTANIQSFMGHSSYKTTEKYVHVESEDLVQAVDYLNPTSGGEALIGHVSEVVAIRKIS
jgi:integrase